MRKISIALLTMLLAGPALAWDGSDTETSGAVEIESGNLVRQGETIDFYDHEAGEYRTGDVQSISRYGSSVEVEVYDNESGEYRTFEMDD